MIDSHIHPDNWGVRPVLFSLWGFEVPFYSAFVLLGLIAGIIVYVVDSRRNKTYNPNSFYIFLAALVFGTIGAKIPSWAANYRLIFSGHADISLLLSGKTIIGGLIGGTLGVAFTKRILNIKEKRGNQFAPAIALGVAIGRIGCFLRGCCYGIAANVPWGVDLGDGVLRHPTQIYEAVFDFGLFIYLLVISKKVSEPGMLFKIFLNWYFAFRFCIEFIRMEKVVFMGLTGFQLVSVLVLLYINKGVVFRLFKRKELRVESGGGSCQG